MNQFYGDTGTFDMAYKCRPDEAERLAKVFGGKSVCLVGNGRSAGANQCRADADGHDLVVRMNKFNILGDFYVGKRMDVHAFSGFAAGHCSTWGGQDYYYCSDGFLERKNFQPWHHEDKLLFWSRPNGQWEDFLSKAWPTTGFRILLDVLNARAEYVTLLGYDLLKTDRFFHKHDAAAERGYIEHLVKTDKRVNWIQAA